MPEPPSPVKVDKQPATKTAAPVPPPPTAQDDPNAPPVISKPVGVKRYKRASSGLSISGLKSQKTEEKKEEEQEDLSNKPKEKFSPEELRSTWNKYGFQARKRGKQGLYVTLSKHIPELKENFRIEFEIDNEIQKIELDAEKADLLSYLRQSLNNYSISLDLKINKEDTGIKHLTSKDKFLKMAEKNPALNQLRERLNLDIEY